HKRNHSIICKKNYRQRKGERALSTTKKMPPMGVSNVVHDHIGCIKFLCSFLNSTALFLRKCKKRKNCQCKCHYNLKRFLCCHSPVKLNKCGLKISVQRYAFNFYLKAPGLFF